MKNASSENRFQIIFNEKEDLNNSILNAVLPGITLNHVIVQFEGINAKIPGDSLEVEEIPITFKLDEDYANYNLIFDWIMNNYRYSNDIDNLQLDKIEYIILDSKYKPLFSFTFSYCFPTSLEAIPHTTQSVSGDELEFTATFQVQGVVKNTSI